MFTARLSFFVVILAAAALYACNSGDSNSGSAVSAVASTSGAEQAVAGACTGATQGATCTFEGRPGHSKTGTCQPAPDESGGLVCVPDHHGFGPPPEAMDACGNFTSGAACSFTGRRGQAIAGTCQSGPDGSGPLACKPNPGQFGPPQEVVDACGNLTVGDACSFTGHRGQTHTGTCQQGRDGNGPLACRPDRSQF